MTITNGAASDDIDVTASNATPADAGTGWALCVPAVSCGTPKAPTSEPAADQFSVATYVGKELPSPISPVASCDEQFDYATSDTGGCAATGTQSATEGLSLTGPTTSTDPSATFAVTITWTAAP